MAAKPTHRRALRPAVVAAAATVGLTATAIPAGAAPAAPTAPAAPSRTDQSTGGNHITAANRQAIAQTAVNEHNTPERNHEIGVNCNAYSGFFGTGAPCANGWRAEEWCSDFAIYTWKAGGADVRGLNAGSVSFYRYGLNHGTWHWGSAGVQPGDAVVYGLNSAGTFSEHVGVYVGNGYVISGNYHDRIWKHPIAEAGVISGYASPV
jgi:hypothetical protein